MGAIIDLLCMALLENELAEGLGLSQRLSPTFFYLEAMYETLDKFSLSPEPKIDLLEA